MEKARNKVASSLGTNRAWLREFLAEFIGTAFLIMVGDGSVAQMKIGVTGFLSVNFGYGLAVAFGVYICGGVSGGHLNPAVTLTMCLFGKLPWCKLPIYMAGQYFGAFFGSVITYVTYMDTINKIYRDVDLIKKTVGGFDPLITVAGIFTTYPADHMNIFPAFMDQVVGTAILLMCVFALTDPRNAGVPKYLVPLLVGLVVAMIGMSYGIQCGYAINPARDLAPRIFAAMVWGADVFKGAHRIRYFFWIPIIGPHLGAILGGLIYQGFIGIHWPQKLEMTPGRQAADGVGKEEAGDKDQNTMEQPPA